MRDDKLEPREQFVNQLLKSILDENTSIIDIMTNTQAWLDQHPLLKKQYHLGNKPIKRKTVIAVSLYLRSRTEFAHEKVVTALKERREILKSL